MKNYYDELEVSKTASKDVIEKVYKVLAKKYHPDTTSETDKKAAEEKFKIISEAYDVLSNDEKRKKYDLDLEKSNPTISYDDYINVIKQRDTLNNNLINLQNQLNQFKNTGTNTYNRNTQTQNPYYQNQYSQNSFHQARYGQPNQNFNNYQNSNINPNYSNQNSHTKKKKYYYNVATGQPVSSFEYFKFRVRKFISNIGFYIIFILILIVLIKNLISMSSF